jgi:hypothetical protein
VAVATDVPLTTVCDAPNVTDGSRLVLVLVADGAAVELGVAKVKTAQVTCSLVNVFVHVVNVAAPENDMYPDATELDPVQVAAVVLARAQLRSAVLSTVSC